MNSGVYRLDRYHRLSDFIKNNNILTELKLRLAFFMQTETSDIDKLGSLYARVATYAQAVCSAQTEDFVQTMANQIPECNGIPWTDSIRQVR